MDYFEDIFERLGEGSAERGEFAIMAPFVFEENRVHLLFEVRSYNLRRQPGEVCFPGGRIEKTEEPQDCAVRETSEELGIPENRIRLIGNVGSMYSLLNEKINVFAGEICEYEDKKTEANPDEVHEVFTVPFEFFVKRGPKESYNFDGHYIWGLTARAVNKILKLCGEGLK